MPMLRCACLLQLGAATIVHVLAAASGGPTAPVGMHTASAADGSRAMHHWQVRPRGHLMQVGQLSVELGVQNNASFRMSVAAKGTAEQLKSTMVDFTGRDAPFKLTHPNSSAATITAHFGSLTVDSARASFSLASPEGLVITSGAFPAVAPPAPTPLAPRGVQITPSCDAAKKRMDCGHSGTKQPDCEASGCCWGPVTPNPTNRAWCYHPNGSPGPPPPPPGPPPAPSPGHNDTCKMVHGGTDVSGPRRVSTNAARAGTTVATCCAGCDADKECTAWVWADAAHPDSSGDNCWLLAGFAGTSSNPGRTFGGVVPPPPPPPPGTLVFKLTAKADARYYGSGGGGGDPLLKTKSSPFVANTHFETSHYWSTDGYSALGVSPFDDTPGQVGHYPAAWAADEEDGVSWGIMGESVDLYLTPAPTASVSVAKYWDLIGAPPVVPRYALGFLACRWGWVDHTYIQEMLSSFRNGSFGGPFPIDAFISDFEWYTKEPDYNLQPAGEPDFLDFGYNDVTFPCGDCCVAGGCSAVTSLLADYHDTYHVRFGGIRKPRLGNSVNLTMARAKGWTVGGQGGGGAAGGSRNLNYSVPALREWYGEQQEHYHSDGVDFWWNDEGETTYYTFFYWNDAEYQGLRKYDAARGVRPQDNKRFFTINRAYTPGMSRMGATMWTGDIGVDWQSLAQQPTYMLNWAMAGVGYTTCDIGGFHGGEDAYPALLIRFYQFGVFLNVMRVHSTLADKPHFPFLFGDKAAAAMKKALHLRYQLVPYLYSLAHHMAAPGGQPMMRPLFFEFPTDGLLHDLSDQWLAGSHLMPAPVLTEDSCRTVYFPATPGGWYLFNSSTLVAKPSVNASVRLSEVPIDTLPLYARAGLLLPLAPVVQYTDQLPGGALHVHVYRGADNSFTLSEDDGETMAYSTAHGDGLTRRTRFTWDDRAKKLTWEVEGTFTAKTIFTAVFATLFGPGAEETSAVKPLGTHGSIAFA